MSRTAQLCDLTFDWKVNRVSPRKTPRVMRLCNYSELSDSYQAKQMDVQSLKDNLCVEERHRNP